MSGISTPPISQRGAAIRHEKAELATSLQLQNDTELQYIMNPRALCHQGCTVFLGWKRRSDDTDWVGLSRAQASALSLSPVGWGDWCLPALADDITPRDCSPSCTVNQPPVEAAYVTSSEKADHKMLDSQDMAQQVLQNTGIVPVWFIIYPLECWLVCIRHNPEIPPYRCEEKNPPDTYQLQEPTVMRMTSQEEWKILFKL